MTNFSTRFSTANDSIVVGQTFGYTHYWNNENITTSKNIRSGNPGYIKGKPIMTGILAYKDVELLKDDQVIKVTIFQNVPSLFHWFTFMTF